MEYLFKFLTTIAGFIIADFIYDRCIIPFLYKHDIDVYCGGK